MTETPVQHNLLPEKAQGGPSPGFFASLPVPIRLALVGLVGATALVLGAAAVRNPPLDEEDDESALVDAGTVAKTGLRPATSRPEQPPTLPVPVKIASAPAPTSAAPTSAPMPSTPLDLRIRLHDDVQGRRLKDAIAALERLLVVDPKASEDGDTRRDLVELAMRVTLLEGREPDQVFDILVNRIGPIGPDILYELMTTRGGSRAAKRSEDLLRDPNVRAKGTAAMRIAYELRSAKSCGEKVALFPRAKTEGDSRTFGLLLVLNHACRRATSECCLHNDPRLRDAIDTLKPKYAP